MPRDPSTYARFVGELVKRYGTEGSLWREHPEVPKTPIRAWELWNEPSLKGSWDEPDWAKGHTELLRATYPVVKRADPGGTVVAAGQPNASWVLTADLYRAGGRPFFDAVAVHPYTGWETTEAGQALLVKALLPALVGQRKRQRIASVYWYTWLTDDRRATISFDVSGLYRLGEQDRVVPKPAASAWRQSVRDLTVRR